MQYHQIQFILSLTQTLTTTMEGISVTEHKKIPS